MQIVDAHLDIAYNAIKYGRDPFLSVQQLRAQEKPDPFRGTATVSFPALREAGVVVIFGTLFTFPESAAALIDGDTTLSYREAHQAHQLAMQQLDYYHRLADDEQNRVRLVTNLTSLEEVTANQPDDGRPLLGIVALMEGADPIRDPAELELWVEKGLRAVGLAWDDTRYATGSLRGSRHGLTRAGLGLLEAMASYHLILDLTHMSEVASLEALDRYDGPLMASHSNARALVPGPRQLSDSVIRGIGERDGVVGIVLYNPFLRANHRKGDPKALVPLDHVVNHVDHICQLLGDAQHVGLGTDMDGGFGTEDLPSPLDSSADLPLLASRLRETGYSEDDIACVMGDNWLRLLRDTFST